LAGASERNVEYLQMICAIACNTESTLNKIVLADPDNEPDKVYHVLSSKLRCFFDFADEVDEVEEAEEAEDGRRGGRDDDINSEGYDYQNDMFDDHTGDLNEPKIDPSQTAIHGLNELLRTTDEERAEFVTEEFINTHNQKALLEVLFPGGAYNSKTAEDTSILAVSNAEVDEWNALIGNMNPEVECVLESTDYFTEVSC